MNIYVGNMSYDTTEDDLREAFSAFGAVSSVSIIMDRETGRPRGFAFVEMSSDEEGKAAKPSVLSSEAQERLNQRDKKFDQLRDPKRPSGDRLPLGTAVRSQRA